MAISGSGGWTPAVRCYVYNRQLRFSGYMHNVPPQIVADVEYAAGYFFDDPSRPGLYIPTVGGGTIYLAELLQEMDVIDPPIIGRARRGMTFDEYQELAQRTSSDEMTISAGLSMAIMGIAGESGEVADLVKKYLFHKHPLDREKIVEEAGDLMWYIAELCAVMDVSMDEVATKNIEKLKRRYPNGFDPERSLHRAENA